MSYLEMWSLSLLDRKWNKWWMILKVGVYYFEFKGLLITHIANNKSPQTFVGDYYHHTSEASNMIVF
jgi:hypothetical protein